MNKYVYFAFSLIIGMFIGSVGIKVGKDFGTLYEIVADTIGLVVWGCVSYLFIYKTSTSHEEEEANSHIKTDKKDIKEYFNIMDDVNEYNEKIGTAIYYPVKNMILLDGIKHNASIAIKKIKKALKNVDKTR